MSTRKAERARAANRNGVSSEPTAPGVRSRGLTRIVGALRAEGSFVLAVAVIGLVKLIASSPEIGEVGHFGPLTEVLLVLIFGVVVYAAIGVVGHAELLAEKYGEPYGTLILTLAAVTVEVVMLTTMMLHLDNNPTLARDTIFATVMILVNGLIGLSLLIGTPFFIVFGWLSDKIGRKPIILGGMALASLTYYPLYSALGNFATPGSVNYPMAILIVVILVNYVGMTYGPIGAFLAEFFPSRIRYTSVSVPYHIGNGWGGGLVPIVTTSMFLSTGSVGWALVYPIVVPAVMFLIAIFVMPETRKHSIWEEGAIEATRMRAKA